VKLKPVLSIDTKKSISHISWREINPDEIFVSFHFSPQICHYNLGEIDPQSPFVPPDIVFLPDGKGINSGGHNTVAVWTRSFSTSANKPLRKEDYIIAASANGYLRCWKIIKKTMIHQTGSFPVSAPGASVSVASSVNDKCYWNIRNDMSRPVSLCRPIIALFIINNNSHLLAVTDEGLFTIWDLIHLKSGAFGSTVNEPSLLSTISLTDRLLLSAVSHRLISKVLPYDGKGSSSQFLLLLEDDSIFLFDLSTKSFLFYQHQYHPTATLEEMVINNSLPLRASLLHAASLSEPIVTTYEGLSSVLTQRPSALACQIPSDVCFLPNSHVVLSSNTVSNSTCSILKKTNLNSSYYNPYYHYSSNNFYHHASSLSYRNGITGLIESSLTRFPYHSYTLPGCIINAEKGSYEILVSHDLQYYFCNDYLTANCLSRTNDLRIEYYDTSLQNDDSSDNRLFSKKRSILHQEYTVDSVRSHYIRLTVPYDGPEVLNGFPKMWLRCNLVPKGWATESFYYQEIVDRKYSNVKALPPPPSSSSLNPTQQSMNLPNPSLTLGSSFSSKNRHWPDGKILDSLDTSASPVVKLCCHPSYPLIFVGHADDSVSVMSYFGKYNFTEDDEKSQIFCARKGIEKYLLYLHPFIYLLFFYSCSLFTAPADRPSYRFIYSPLLVRRSACVTTNRDC
jgi:hypothetical protein